MSEAREDCVRCPADDCVVRKAETLEIGQRVRYDGHEWTVLDAAGEDDPFMAGTFVLKAAGDQDFDQPVVTPDMVEKIG